MTSDLSWSVNYYWQSLLSLIHRTFSSFISVDCRKRLYLSLVRAQLTYCSPVRRPHLLIDIKKLQRRATKFILNDYVSDYRARLIKLDLLPLMMVYEINVFSEISLFIQFFFQYFEFCILLYPANSF